jgi:23S rRNA (guanine2445-N2)-methyltransferase / 23S rRNA (guanine2069-N7)-methyltransferase
LEDLLAAELRGLGAAAVTTQRGGVAFRGPLEVAYRACLWSRVASRILLPLASFSAPTPEALYAGVRAIRWREHLRPRGTLAVDCAASGAAIAAHFAALKTKDAIADQLRDECGVRPSVDRVRPDLRVNLYLQGRGAVVSIDLSGESLHRRGYRGPQRAAPLKENLAAALLLLAEWPRRARDGAALLDPMCGSGTIPIEAALMAADIAPGMFRSAFGFLGWRGHDPTLWARLRQEAADRQIRAARRLPVVRGSDVERAAVRAAQANATRAGVERLLHFEPRPLAECMPPTVTGLVVTNPPYGERLGAGAALEPLYAQLGDVLRQRFPGWTAYVLTGNRALGRRIGLRPARRLVLYNGPVECRLLVLPISSQPVRDAAGPRWRRTCRG